MKILIFGDIFGRFGLNAIEEKLQDIKQKYNPDLTIANGENVSTGGKSLVFEDYQRLKAAGIDAFTMGNHTFRNPRILEYINDVNDVCVPANLKDNLHGKDHLLLNVKGKRVLIINLLGKSFMKEQTWSAFEVVDDILDTVAHDIVIVDYHAETTSEKLVVSNAIKERVNIFFGTHTHVQTSDERVIGTKTAYITDVGMVGVFDSAIGVNFDEVEEKMKDPLSKVKFVEAAGRVRVNGLFVEIDDNTEKILKLERISEDVDVDVFLS